MITKELSVSENEWVVSNRILAFAHRFLGSPRCKQCSSLERNVGQKVVWTFKKRILARHYGFFAAVLSKWIKIMLIRGKVSKNYHKTCYKKDLKTSLFPKDLMWNRHRVMVSKYYKISHTSLGNNSFRSFQLNLYLYSLFSYLLRY